MLLFILPAYAHGQSGDDAVLDLTQEEQKWLADHPVIRVAPDPSFSPIEFFDKRGELQGIAADYLKLLESKLSIHFEILPIKSWSEAIDKAKQREADMFSAATRSPERDEYMQFTSPLIELPGVIIVNRDNNESYSMNSLNRRKVAIVSGYIWQEWISHDYPLVDIVPVMDVKTGLEKVAFGEVDAMVSSIAVASYYIRQHGITNLRVAGQTGYWTRLAMATRKDWSPLNGILEKAIASIDQEQKQAIYNRWVYLAPKSIFDNRIFWIILFIAFGITITISIAVLFWNRSLRYAVKHKTEDLAASETRLQQFFDASFEGLLIHQRGKIIDVNPGVSEIFGYTADELIGQNLLSFVDPEARDELIQNMTIENEGPYETRALRKDGEVIPTAVRAKSMEWNGTKMRVVGLLDITKQKQVEEALRLSEEKFSMAFRASPAPITISSLEDGIFIEVNDTFQGITGYTQEEVEGKSGIELNLWTNVKQREKMIQELKENGRVRDMEVRMRMKNSDIRYFLISAEIIMIEYKPYILMVGVNITERKIAEEALKTSEAKMIKVFRSIPDAISITSLESGRFIDFNEGFENLFGFSRQELSNKTSTELGIWADLNERKAFNKLLQETMEMQISEFDMRTKSGEIRRYEISAEIIDINNEQCVVANMRDITERKKQERERQQLQYQLFRSQKMEAIGQLTGGIAHDFNNNLTSILGFTRLALKLNTDGGKDKLTNYLNQILHAGERARNMVKQMLTYSRDTESEPSDQLLQPLLEGALQLLRPSIPSSIDIESHLPRELPKVKIDATQFEQVVMNLCINARDAIEGHGAIVIKLLTANFDGMECHSCHESINGDYIELSIKDSGAGMSANTKPRIFEPFYTTKEVGSGTGMGLSIVHGIMHNCGGHIRLSSSPDAGTTFHLLFPIVEETLVKEKTLELNKPAQENDQPMQGVIMLVDDESLIINYLKELLELKGFHVLTFTRSMDALDYFLKAPDDIDLIITDQTMPRMTGLELAQEILRKCPDMPIILCTGYSEQVDETIAKQSGITEFLKKPIDDTALLGKINELITNRVQLS